VVKQSEPLPNYQRIV